MSYGHENIATKNTSPETALATNFHNYLTQIIFLTGDIENSIEMLRQKNAQLFGEAPEKQGGDNSLEKPLNSALSGRVYEELAALKNSVEELRKEIKIILEI